LKVYPKSEAALALKSKVLKGTNLFLIARRELGPTHGTGQQLSILRQMSTATWQHIGWDIPAGISPSEYCPDVDLTPCFQRGWLSRLPLHLGSRVGHRLGYGLFGSRNLEKARRCLNEHPKAPVLAVVASERDARMVNHLVGTTEHSLRLLVFDYCHALEPTQENLPEWAGVCRRAESVFALGPSLCDAMTSLGSANVEEIHFARSAPEVERVPVDQSVLRVAMIGSLAYPDGMARLSDAMDSEDMAQVELHHTGPSHNLDYVPEELRRRLVSHGLVSEKARDEILATCQGAILPGPDLDPAVDAIARYSVPSRLADYAFHGLPVITLAKAGSGLVRYLDQYHELRSVRVDNASALRSAILGLSVRKAAEEAAIRRFAREHYDARHAYKDLLSAMV